jgi:acid phosphatase class B
MQIGIDIDDTITAIPEFFRELTASFVKKGHEVHIITSRTETEEARKETEKELKGLGIVYAYLYFLPPYSVAKEQCPHRELDWHEKYLNQKVEYCLKKGISIYYEDDGKVVGLFQKYAPDIRVLQVHGKQKQD